MDVIRQLPLGIIENILCYLPIQEAARTSILSREWRYRWTKIPKLVFDDRAFRTQSGRIATDDKQRRLFYTILQVLLMHQGPIREFVLSTKIEGSCIEIDQMILHLARRDTVKMLGLYLTDLGAGQYRLPLSLFSLHRLTKLNLRCCCLLHLRAFDGFEFSCLTTLHLLRFTAHDETFLRLLSSCPSLKRLTLFALTNKMCIEHTGHHYTVVDLFECLPMIEYLSISSHIVWRFHPDGPDRLLKELPTKLVHLTCLQLEYVSFSTNCASPLLDLLSRSSPNLEKLKLVMLPRQSDEDVLPSFRPEDYSDFMMAHLSELEIRYIRDTQHARDFLKLILGRLPVLKKVRVIFNFISRFSKDEESEIFKFISSIPCASPAVIFHCEG